MDEEMISIAARMSVHEFLLEIFYANMCAHEPTPSASLEHFRKTVLDRLRYKSWVQGEDTGDETLLIQEKALEIAESFFNKVASRTSDISAQLSQRRS